MELTTFAQEKVAYYLEETKKDMPEKELFLHLSVSPGGCAGLRYQTYFDYQPLNEDEVFQYPNFAIRIDKLSAPYLTGAKMDFKDELNQQGFTIDNPNAQGSCSCGDSFN